MPIPTQVFYRKIETFPWTKWFAWYPVNLHGNRAWFNTVYRRRIISWVDNDSWKRYEYGTIFDVLHGEK